MRIITFPLSVEASEERPGLFAITCQSEHTLYLTDSASNTEKLCTILQSIIPSCTWLQNKPFHTLLNLVVNLHLPLDCELTLIEAGYQSNSSLHYLLKLRST